MDQNAAGGRKFGRRQAIGLAATGAVGTSAAASAALAIALGHAVNAPTESAFLPGPDTGSKPQADPDLGFLAKPVDHSGHGAEPDLIRAENAKPGTSEWRLGSRTAPFKASDDIGQQVKGYASATSVTHGEMLGFHVHTATPQDVTVDIYRMGYYGGKGGRAMLTSPPLHGTPQNPPATDPHSGMVTCDWDVLWTLDVPAGWTSGTYLAVLRANGYASYVPFVVRDDRRTADFLAVLPFTTYQAYNQYPLDGKTGKSLYDGYKAGAANGSIAYETRSAKVSFDRPWSTDGWPAHFEDDLDGIAFLEANGYSVVYATSLDLHSGRVDPRRYQGIVFTGHDEYWSWQMREVVQAARDHGVHLAFLSANSVYWNIRVEQSADGRQDRVVVCHKDFPDPVRDTTRGHERLTKMWRDIGRPEQSFVGIQVNTQVKDEDPLTIAGDDHWFWAGTGAKNGDKVPRLLSAEVDMRYPDVAIPENLSYTLLADSVYHDKHDGLQQHNASIYQALSGAWVFSSGTFGWVRGLSRVYYTDQRIQQATRNLLDKFRA